MALDLARSIDSSSDSSTDRAVSDVLDLVVDQLEALEARAGRRAVHVSVAIPPSLDPARTRERLLEHLGRGRIAPPDIAIMQSMSARSRARLITVDFELEEPGETEEST